MKGRRPLPSGPRRSPGFAARRTGTGHSPRLSTLDDAERLIAEQGVYALSNRWYWDGAAPVGGHRFVTKADLVRASIRRFTSEVERARAARLTELDGTAGIRDWLGCLVYPWTDNFAEHDTTYFARLCAQALTDTTLKTAMTEEAILSPTLLRTREALARRLPALPANVAAQREEVVIQVIVHTCAERERAIAAGASRTRSAWRGLGGSLVDALTGIWTAPCTSGLNTVTTRTTRTTRTLT